MSYMILMDNPDHIDGEEVKYIKGTESLEKYTDSRILRIYAHAKGIYKLYANSICIILKGEN